MKKLLFVSILLTTIFSACGSEESTGTGDENDFMYTYKTAEFQMEALEDWEVIDSFTSEYPSGLRVAFRSNVKDSVFTANVNVFAEENSDNETSYDFAERKLADHEDTLLNYKLLEQETIALNVAGAESKTVLNKFEGKNETAGPTLRFIQVTLTEAETAWTVTAAYRPGEDEFLIGQMETILRSFTLR